LDQRLIDLSDSFSEFRFTKLRVHAWFSNLSATSYDDDIVVAYTPTILSASPTLTQMVSLPYVKIGCGAYGAPYPILTVPKRELMGAVPVKWFRRGSTYDDLFETQGTIYYGTRAVLSAAPMSIWIEYEVELRSQADVALTTMVPRAVDPLAQVERVLGMVERAPQAGGAEEKKADPPVAAVPAVPLPKGTRWADIADVEDMVLVPRSRVVSGVSAEGALVPSVVAPQAARKA